MLIQIIGSNDYGLSNIISGELKMSLSNSRLIFSMVLCIFFNMAGYTQAPSSVDKLVLGKPIARELKAGEVHIYSLQLETEQIAEFIIDQATSDVMAMVNKL
jgi:hypothetical protein